MRSAKLMSKLHKTIKRKKYHKHAISHGSTQGIWWLFVLPNLDLSAIVLNIIPNETAPFVVAGIIFVLTHITGKRINWV